MKILWKVVLAALVLTMSRASGMEPVAFPLWRLTSATQDDSADFGRLPLLAKEPSAGRLLSRHKRYLVFPEGSTFNAAFCATSKVYVSADVVIFTEGVAWGASFDLPNNTRVLASAGAGVEPDDLRRRTERSGLYRRLERAADSAGLDGRSCVLRALCEADQLLAPGHSIATELMRVAFAVSANDSAKALYKLVLTSAGSRPANCINASLQNTLSMWLQGVMDKAEKTVELYSATALSLLSLWLLLSILFRKLSKYK